MDVKFELMLAAVALSPLIAVQVSAFLQRRTDATERRRDIFRTLMATRRTTLNWDRIQALNLIDVEFYRSRKVRSAWNALITHLTVANPSATDPVHVQRGQVLTTDLLFEMAKDLGYDLDRTDIERQGYYPQASLEVELEGHRLRRTVLELLEALRNSPAVGNLMKELIPDTDGKKSITPPDQPVS